MENFRFQEVNVIVGAGLTGLSAAYHLAENGEKCVVLEKNNEIGGMCRSINLDDIIFDLGPHFFFDNPDFDAERFMMTLLKGEEVIKNKFRFSIRKDGKDWKFPLSIRDMIRFPREYKLKLLSQLFLRRRNKADMGTSVRAEMLGKLGSSYYEGVIAPMLKCKTLFSGDQIHRDWLTRVDRDVNNSKEPFQPISPIKHILLTIRRVLFSETYLYPARGYNVFPQKLWERYKQLGGKTVLDCGRLTFIKEDDRISKVVAGDKEFSVKNVIWTASINDLNDVIESNIPRINFVKVVIVLLTFHQNNHIHRPFGYVYHPDNSLIFNRFYYPSSVFGSYGNREGLCFELNYSEELNGMPDNEIIDKTVRDAEKLGLFTKQQLRRSMVVRLGECMPVYDLDYENKIKEVFTDVHQIQNLYSIGRLGGYYFCMSPAAVNQGIKMAKHILKNNL